MCVCYRKCFLGNTPQYLSQIKSDLHKTFSIFQKWSPDLTDNIHVHACARVHAQCVKKCMLLLCLFCYFFVRFFCYFEAFPD